MKMQTVSPGDPGFNDIDNKVKEQTGVRVDYEALKERYNAMSKGSIMLLKLVSTVKIANMSAVIDKRGLERNRDYTITRIKRDTNGIAIPLDLRPVAIKKVSNRAMGNRANVNY